MSSSKAVGRPAVTGGTAGVGRAVPPQLARQGPSVAVLTRSRDAWTTASRTSSPLVEPVAPLQVR